MFSILDIILIAKTLFKQCHISFFTSTSCRFNQRQDEKSPSGPSFLRGKWTQLSGHLLSSAGKAHRSSCLSEGFCHNGHHVGQFIASLFTFSTSDFSLPSPFFCIFGFNCTRNASFVLSLNYIKPMGRKQSELSFFKSIKLRTLSEVPPQKNKTKWWWWWWQLTLPL